MSIQRLKTGCIVLIFMVVCVSGAYAGATTTAADRTQVTMTVYAQDLAYVEEERTVSFAEGMQMLTCADVPRTIVPESIVVTSDEQVQFTEQSFRHDAQNRYQLMSLYVGKPVRVVRRNEYQDRDEILEAILLSADTPPMYQVNDAVHIGAADTIILPLSLEECALLPSLVWKCNSEKAKRAPVSFSYLMRGVSWQANYSLVLTDGDTALLSSWVTLINGAGVAFDGATVRVLSGTVERMPQYRAKSLGRGVATPMMEMAQSVDTAAIPHAADAGDFNVYTLPQKIDLHTNENKQVPLFDDSHIQYEKEYRAESPSHWYYQQMREPEETIPVQIFITAMNTKETGLGMPLPAGQIRVYETHEDSKIFVGEVAVGRVATDEELSFKHGEASDLYVERTQMAFQQITRGRAESSWRIAVRNRSEETKTVVVRETLQRSWDMLECSHDFEKKSASLIDFTVAVEPGEEEIISFRISTGL